MICQDKLIHSFDSQVPSTPWRGIPAGRRAPGVWKVQSSLHKHEWGQKVGEMPQLSPAMITISNRLIKKGKTSRERRKEWLLQGLRHGNLCRCNDASPLTAATTHWYGEKPIRTITALTHYQFNYAKGNAWSALCVHMCVYLCVCAHIWMHTWKPEVDVRCLPHYDDGSESASHWSRTSQIRLDWLVRESYDLPVSASPTLGS